MDPLSSSYMALQWDVPDAYYYPANENIGMW